MRNFSMEKYWNKKMEEWEPELSFTGKSRQDWEQWQSQAANKFKQLRGDYPETVDLNPEIEYSVQDGDLIRERVVLDSEKYMSIPCQLLKPAGMKSDSSHAAILCSHGHGAYGKDVVAGMKSSPDHKQVIEEHNYNYGEQMARAGFLTISPDLRGFGERSDKKNGVEPFPGRDECNVNFIKGVILGSWTLTGNIWDMKCCIDYLETRSEVDPERIGMMGLSQGGTMTAFTAAAEPRIKAADIIGYINSWKEFGIKQANFCGSQIFPNIFRYFDTHDIAGLIAPRPLLVEMGIYDKCFYLRDTIKGFKSLQKIYKAAGAEDNLYKDIHSGPHAYGGNKAESFFKNNL